MSLPRITKQPDDVNVTTSCSSASFVCTASGYGIKIMWKRVTYTLPVTADVTEVKSLNELSSILTISEVVSYYSGQYYCIVENEVGNVTSRIVNLCVKSSKVNAYNNIDSYICMYCQQCLTSSPYTAKSSLNISQLFIS